MVIPVIEKYTVNVKQRVYELKKVVTDRMRLK